MGSPLPEASAMPLKAPRSSRALTKRYTSSRQRAAYHHISNRNDLYESHNYIRFLQPKDPGVKQPDFLLRLVPFQSVQRQMQQFVWSIRYTECT